MAKRKALKPEQYRAIALMIYKDVNGLTNEQIAQEVGVNPSTIYEWKKKDYFNDELIRQSEQVQRSFLSDAYTQIRMIVNNDKVSTGNKLKALEMILKNQGRLKEVTEQHITHEEKDFGDLLQELKDL